MYKNEICLIIYKVQLKMDQKPKKTRHYQMLEQSVSETLQNIQIDNDVWIGTQKHKHQKQN